MARLPYLEADQVAPEYRDILKRNTNLHKLLVNSPDMARAFNGIGSYIRFKSKLDPRLRELAILQVGWMEKSEYEFTHHVKIGQDFGVTDADIQGLLAETEGKPSGLEPLARAILRGAREMGRDLAMADATFAEIKKHLSDEHMTDLVLTIAFYCAVVRVLATMKIDNEPTYKEVLKQDRISGVNCHAPERSRRHRRRRRPEPRRRHRQRPRHGPHLRTRRRQGHVRGSQYRVGPGNGRHDRRQGGHRGGIQGRRHQADRAQGHGCRCA